MILKTLDYRKCENHSGFYDVWNYFDNITSASNYFDETAKMTVVRCIFKDGNTVSIAVPYEAYLMSDVGKTIDRIYTHEYKPGVAEDGRYDTLQDAVDAASKE